MISPRGAWTLVVVLQLRLAIANIPSSASPISSLHKGVTTSWSSLSNQPTSQPNATNFSSSVSPASPSRKFTSTIGSSLPYSIASQPKAIKVLSSVSPVSPSRKGASTAWSSLPYHITSRPNATNSSVTGYVGKAGQADFKAAAVGGASAQSIGLCPEMIGAPPLACEAEICGGEDLKNRAHCLKENLNSAICECESCLLYLYISH